MVPAHPPVARNRPPKSPGVCGRGGGRGGCEQSVNLPMKRRIPGSDRRRSVTEPPTTIFGFEMRIYDAFYVRYGTCLMALLPELFDAICGIVRRTIKVASGH